MRKPNLILLYTFNALNYLYTELYLRTVARNASPYVKSCHRDIASDIRALRIKLRHTDPYNASIHAPTHNLLTLQTVRDLAAPFIR
ncbi:hypothetical protein AX777_05775 [Sphingobium yanoikuyae]|uniref:Uncharacterized protein n=1 Tax=Sphingobium yanoikuyae TaxID=13690 RepID=A0A177JR45_SPHYA|nr:hypothetical protein [Sphingobium yanoikuyae]OAH42745.1 hypothetical protein AX777_05775 [Sphingobium yanoikuyae]